MAHIKIDYDMLNQEASRLNSQIQEYESLGSRVNTLIGQMQASWEGEACNAYTEMMQRYMMQSQKMVGILNAFKSYATGASEDFAEIDMQCAALIRNSF